MQKPTISPFFQQSLCPLCQYLEPPPEPVRRFILDFYEERIRGMQRLDLGMRGFQKRRPRVAVPLEPNDRCFFKSARIRFLTK